ncbi:Trafficking protein particle complex subunit 2-like protein [Blomia tropicalis]|nr:Trafficking protein particle complex subunit 2-like protein [Blomia tropicalis]
MSVLALAIINKRNTPVLVRTRDQDSLGILFKLHSSLDVVDEKQSANTREPFLGILAQSDSYKIYGLCSVTQTKVLLMVSNTMVRDNEARSILRTIYNTYVDVTTNNPFYTYGHQVTSKYLQQKVNEIFS